MVLPGTVFRALLPLAALASSALQGLLDTPRSSAVQTEWQKALFKNVSERAAQLSDAAVPALLERLDSSSFRAALAKCCPSVSGLTAAKLLERLQEEALVSEVVSGFPDTVDPDKIYPTLPIMSIADGLRGSFFQNSWQGVLLDAKDPGETFHKALDSYVSVKCRGGSVLFDVFGFSRCTGEPIVSFTYPVDQCVSDQAAEGSIVKWSVNSTALTQALWLQGRKARLSLHSSLPRSFLNVSCPTDPPNAVMTYELNKVCFNFSVPNESNGWVDMDSAEIDSYGLKPFASSGAPKSLKEASERGPYALVNQFLYDQGSLLYGQVSAVFSFQAMRDTALLSAIDTGYYVGSCVKHQSFGWRPFNCSVYEPLRQLGTMRHFNHLFLINEDFWMDPLILAQRFARLEGDWGSSGVVGRDMLNYWEALPAATLQFPHGIRFLIGSFPSLFGSTSGASLQRWAKQRGWVLVWSLGANIGKRDDGSTLFRLVQTNQTFSLNQRLLDPEVALKTTAAGNLSLDEGLLRKFRRSWEEVEALRKLSPGGVSNSTWAKQWHRLTQALPPKLHMRPLRAGSCPRSPDAPECVGVNGDGHCICYSQTESTVAGVSGELFV